jgi:hypothetical protein
VPDPGERDACFIFPGRGGGLRHPYGVNLMVEIFVDATITAFMISLLHWPLRFRDVRLGIIPLIEPDAFPRGFVLTLLFPNWIDCLDSQRPTRNGKSRMPTHLGAIALRTRRRPGGPAPPPVFRGVTVIRVPNVN